MLDFVVTNFVVSNFAVMNFVVTNFVVVNFEITTFVVKKQFEKGVAHGKFRAPILLFYKAPTFSSGFNRKGNMQIQRRQLSPEKKKRPRAIVQDKYLSFDTTSYHPFFLIGHYL